MTIRWLALPILATAVCVVGSSPSKAYAACPQDRAYAQHDEGGWDTPPADFRDVKRQGYHDGIDAARKDYDHHRQPNVNGRNEYKHPPVDGSAREDYRDGFRRGYSVAMHHLMENR